MLIKSPFDSLSVIFASAKSVSFKIPFLEGFRGQHFLISAYWFKVAATLFHFICSSGSWSAVGRGVSHPPPWNGSLKVHWRHKVLKFSSLQQLCVQWQNVPENKWSYLINVYVLVWEGFCICFLILRSTFLSLTLSLFRCVLASL